MTTKTRHTFLVTDVDAAHNLDVYVDGELLLPALDIVELRELVGKLAIKLAEHPLADYTVNPTDGRLYCGSCSEDGATADECAGDPCALYKDVWRRQAPAMRHRAPYVGEGADGARRSAQIDREEVDTLPTGPHQVGYGEASEARRARLLDSAERWDKQADELERLTELRFIASGPASFGRPSRMRDLVREDLLAEFVDNGLVVVDNGSGTRGRVLLTDAGRAHIEGATS